MPYRILCNGVLRECSKLSPEPSFRAFLLRTITQDSVWCQKIFTSGFPRVSVTMATL
jgi:hypothetical protein